MAILYLTHECNQLNCITWFNLKGIVTFQATIMFGPRFMSFFVDHFEFC